MDEQEQINENMRLFETGTRSWNLRNFPVQRNASPSHELKKILEATQLILEGRTIVINGILRNGGIPDVTIVDLPEPLIYEVMKSEQMKSIKIKEKHYKFRIIPIQC